MMSRFASLLLMSLLLTSGFAMAKEWSEDLGVLEWGNAMQICKDKGMKLPKTQDFYEFGKNVPSDWTPGYYWTSSTKTFTTDQAERTIVYKDTNRLVVNGDMLPKTYRIRVRCVKDALPGSTQIPTTSNAQPAGGVKTQQPAAATQQFQPQTQPTSASGQQ